MIDTWEIFGRILTDKNFRKAVFKAAPRNKPKINGATRAEFRAKAYENMRDAVTPKISDRPISLAGLGEILWPLVNNAKNFRKAIENLASTIDVSGVDTDRDDPYFYVALGAMVVDPNLRDELVSQPPYSPFDDYGFTMLSEDDRAALVAIFNYQSQEGSGPEPTAASDSDAVCQTQWTSDCFLRTIWWEYPPARGSKSKKLVRRPHGHPVPLPGPPRAAKRK